MGYDVRFEGEFAIDRPIDEETMELLEGLDWDYWKLSDTANTIEALFDETNCRDEGFIQEIKDIMNDVLIPQGYHVNGKVHWYGDDRYDMGWIAIENDKVKVCRAVITYETDEEGDEVA